MRPRLIVNPSANAGRCRAHLQELKPLLYDAWEDLEWVESENAEHVTRLAREAADAGCRELLVAGGDGTARFAARGLVGSETALGIVPVGSGNDFARSVGVPKDGEAAVKLLKEMHVRRVDLGQAGPEVFCCVLGVGMDTAALDVINGVLHRWPMIRRGNALYSYAAMRTILTYRADSLTVSYDGGRHEGRLLFAAVTNTKTYAGGMRISPAAEVDDGRLDLCLIAHGGFLRMLVTAGQTMKGRHLGMRGVTTVQSRRVRFESARPMPVTLDGDYSDLRTPVEVTVLSGALKLLGAPVKAAEAPPPEPLPKVAGDR